MEEITIFKNIYSSRDGTVITLIEFLAKVKSGEWKNLISSIQAESNSIKRNELKTRLLPYVTVSGAFPGRRANTELKQHSGFIAIDFDDKDNAELFGNGKRLREIKSKLAADEYTYSVFLSASMRGLCVIVKIDGGKHKECYTGLEKYYTEKYGLKADTVCKDVARPRFVSYDAELYLNKDSKLFTPDIQENKSMPAENVSTGSSDMERLINEVVSRKIDITSGYFNWIKIGFVLADTMGEKGRELFHSLSQFNKDYTRENTNKQYSQCLRHKGYQGVKAMPATLFYLAEKYGVKLPAKNGNVKQEQKADKITKSESSAAKQTGKAELDEMTKGNGKISKNSSSSNTELPMLERIELFLKNNYDLRRNVISGEIECGGVPMKDEEFNSVWIETCRKLNIKARFSDIDRIINSDRTPCYNPIIAFIDKNAEKYNTDVEKFRSENGKFEPWKHEESLFRRLAKSLNPTMSGKEGIPLYPPSEERGLFIPNSEALITNHDALNYYAKMITKWYVGMISAVHGKPSSLFLVLSGEKQGTGKTEFFRRLLPQALRGKYYAESKLDEGKDSLILMSRKLLISDDEMGGKSKREVKRLKHLTSMQDISLRLPYGRRSIEIKRLALLCGTTNDCILLNDPTGNRRIIPLHVEGMIDFAEYNAIDKTALFMEAYGLWSAGLEWELTPEDIKELADNSESFEEVPMEMEMILKYFSIPESWAHAGEFTPGEIAKILKEQSRYEFTSNAIGRCLAKLGVIPRIKRVNGQIMRLYKLKRN